MKADHFDQQRLLALAAEDVALSQLAHRLRTLPEGAAVSTAEDAERELAGDVVRAETAARDQAREQRRLEADVDVVAARVAKDRARLDGGSASPKEMTGLQHELESLARRQSDLEDQVLELMERRESADTTLAEAQRGVATARETLAAAVAARDAALGDIATSTSAHEATRADVAASVPAPLLALYDRVRAQTGTSGAARLHARRCEGCRIELYGNELSAARNADPHEVLRCENCNRILVRTADSGL